MFKSMFRELRRQLKQIAVRPSPFISGIGSVMSIGGNYFTIDTHERDVDSVSASLREDWESLGEDFYTVLWEEAQGNSENPQEKHSEE